MKSIVEILELVKSRYIGNSKYSYNSGMCLAAYELYEEGILSNEEREVFYQYYMRSVRSKKIFYQHSGKKTDERNQFAWPVDNKEARLKWFDRNISRQRLIQEGLEPNRLYEYEDDIDDIVKLIGVALNSKGIPVVILRPIKGCGIFIKYKSGRHNLGRAGDYEIYLSSFKSHYKLNK